jgi:VanZ family protein
VFQKLYRYLFWTGYLLVLITAFVNIGGSFLDIKLGRGIFKIRLDQLLHFTVYFLICLYLLLGRRKGLKLFNTNSLLKFILLVLLLATVTEFVQIWVPGRSFNVFDWVANVSGMLVGVGMIKLAERHKGMRA